jgi:hypothetical protein
MLGGVGDDWNNLLLVRGTGIKGGWVISARGEDEKEVYKLPFCRLRQKSYHPDSSAMAGWRCSLFLAASTNIFHTPTSLSSPPSYSFDLQPTPPPSTLFAPPCPLTVKYECPARLDFLPQPPSYSPERKPEHPDLLDVLWLVSFGVWCAIGRLSTYGKSTTNDLYSQAVAYHNLHDHHQLSIDVILTFIDIVYSSLNG